MSVNITSPAQSISESLDLLRTTPSVMHRIHFMLSNTGQWYAVMREARQAYGTEWRSQPRVKRKLERCEWTKQQIDVWFEVPDPAFATWCAVKLGVEAAQVPAK